MPGAGYREAPVIVQGMLQPGTGGGICQVSSTMYNAALLADLQIVRRSHHAFPVHYLPAGRDATVAYGSIDFKFQNDTDNTIAIAANGQPAAAAYHRDEDGMLRAFGIAVLDVTTTGIARIVVFGDPGLFTLFGLSLVLPPEA